MSRISGSLLAIVSAWWLAAPQAAWSCPFCSAVQQTFSEEIIANDAAVIVELVERPEIPDAELGTSGTSAGPAVKSTFKITQVIKGAEIAGVAPGKLINVLYFGQEPVGSKFLVYGVDPASIAWTTPTPLADRGVEYVTTLTSLPETGADRLAFFQEYLEDEDRMLAADAYDEFARAPYADVVDLADRMHHGQLVRWISDVELPASRRRLYLTMLGACGTAADVDLLEIMITSNDRQTKAALDALVACYLKLKGPEGLPVIVDLFIKNKDAEYTDTYSTIMALRFHGQELEVIPKEDLQAALRHMLDRPNLADLVIPDLARWEDWSVMDRLVTLFKEADEDSSWVRVPVVNYLRACPLPEAEAQIAELKKIDPDAVKRASYFFPLGASGAAPAPKPTEKKTSATDGAPAKENSKTDDAQTAAPMSTTENTTPTGGLSVFALDPMTIVIAAAAVGGACLLVGYSLYRKGGRPRVPAA